jgi:hypothetical protein
MSFLELVLDPTTSGKANVFNIWSAIVSPPPILEVYWILSEPYSAERGVTVASELRLRTDGWCAVRLWGVYAIGGIDAVVCPSLYQTRPPETDLLAAMPAVRSCSL